MPDSRLTIQEQLALVMQRTRTSSVSRCDGASDHAHAPHTPRGVVANPKPLDAGLPPRQVTSIPSTVVAPTDASASLAHPDQSVQHSTDSGAAPDPRQFQTAEEAREPRKVDPRQGSPAAQSDDLDVLAQLEKKLRQRECSLIDKSESLEWDQLGHQNAVELLTVERLHWEERAKKEQSRLTDLEAVLNARDKALTDHVNANRNEAQRLKVQSKAQDKASSSIKKKKERLDAREKRVRAAESLHKERRDELTAAKALVGELEADLKKEKRARTKLQRELDAASDSMLSALHIPNWDVVARWMLSGVDVDLDQFPATVAFNGDGPFKQSDLETKARELSLRVTKCGAKKPATVLVIGRKGWSRLAIESHIGAAESSDLLIFPQELWIASLLIRYNPFLYLEDPACRAAVEAFGNGHSAIEWLRGMEFPWPMHESCADPPLLDLDQQVQASPLVKLEYRVGTTRGQAQSTRRSILSQAFEAESLPLAEFEAGVSKADRRAYMDSWGAPQSRTRLRRIAWHLAMLIKMHARLRNHDVAVEEWVADLSWLRQRHYSKFMRFRWP